MKNMPYIKPKEILELEKLLETEFENIDINFEGSIPENTYQLNGEGKVRLLHIHHHDQKIEDLSFLKDFIDLEWLRYGSNRLRTIEHLVSLTKLKILVLIQNDFEDISALSKLTDLECIFLTYNKIKHVSSLAKLPRLRQLYLSNNEIEDITPIQNLKNLEILNLACNCIKDISSFKDFSKLKDVCLYGNNISNYSILNHNHFPSLTSLEIDCNLIEDYSFLKNLSRLKSLALSEAKITDFTVFENLTNLISFGLSDSDIKDISFLANFKNLVWLSMPRNKIKNIEVLQNLNKLKCIELQNNNIQNFPKWLLTFKVGVFLKEWNFTLSNEGMFRNQGIYLYQNPLLNIPKELLKEDKNIYEELDSYFRYLDKGNPKKNNEVKVVFIGNGSVGKTQIVKRLVEKEKFIFDEEHKSTFGIQLLQTKIESEILKEGLVLNCWDFAGQDFYHATHRVFMQTRAVFVLVWDWENENNDFHESNGKKYDNQNLRYWLEYATHFGKKSPILVIQNKIDALERNRRLPEPEKKKLKAEFPNIVDFLEVSAKTNIGFRIFESALSKSFTSNEQLKKEILLELPSDWVRLRNRIRANQRMKPMKRQKMTKQQFAKWCEKESINEKDTNVILTFLHDTGVLFHNKHSTKYEIILDQTWAIKAIFQVINQENPYYEVLTHNKGELKYKDLCEIWKNYNDTEKTVFINLMIVAELCFEKTYEKEYLKNRVFIVPHFFQDTKPWYIDSYINDHAMFYKEKIEFSFLPQAFMHRFIIHYNKQAELEDMWQSGIYLKNEDTHIIVEAKAKEKTIIMHHNCTSGNEFIKKVKNDLYNINKNLSIKAKQGHKDFLDQQTMYINSNNKSKMSKKPSALFTFAANDLKGVILEAEKIWNIVSQNDLVNATKKDAISIDDLGDAIDDCKDLMMFHFGGHANQGNIVLNDFRNLDKIRLSRLLGLDIGQHNLQRENDIIDNLVTDAFRLRYRAT